MALAQTTIKIEPEKLELMKAKGINLSQLCRDAIDSCLKLSAGDVEMLKDQLAEVEKQMQILSLEKKLILSRLQELESEDALLTYRDSKYEKWKTNIAYQIKHKTVDWTVSKELFRFSSIEDTKKWLTAKLTSEGLI